MRRFGLLPDTITHVPCLRISQLPALLNTVYCMYTGSLLTLVLLRRGRRPLLISRKNIKIFWSAMLNYENCPNCPTNNGHQRALCVPLSMDTCKFFQQTWPAHIFVDKLDYI
jgi:hypothetical protein